MAHQFACRVYYEDTDMAGIVYYANYLKFIERARSEWVAELGVDQAQMRDAGKVFAVRRVEADYLAPAKFGDDLVVTTQTRDHTAASWTLDQVVTCQGQELFRAIVVIVCLNAAGRPTRLPAEFRAKVT